MIEFLKDLYGFIRQRRKWWLVPFIFVLLVLSILIWIGGSSAISPFIYSLF